MKSFSRIRNLAIAGLMAGVLSTGQAGASVSYVFDPSSPVNVDGIVNYQTTGAMMDGLRVTAIFNTAAGGTFSETLQWADTGADSGGVSSQGWSLGLTGDSYDNQWNFAFTPGVAAMTLTRLVLEGDTGYTVFDLWLDGDKGTPDSEAGRNFEFLMDYSVTATYSRPVGVAGSPPYDDGFGSGPDIWQVLTIDFANGIRQDFSFRQDTDNESRIPEPASLALLGIGLLGLGIARRRKH